MQNVLGDFISEGSGVGGGGRTVLHIIPRTHFPQEINRLKRPRAETVHSVHDIR